MGLYDDGGVEFAKTEINAAQERGRKAAKEAEKAGRKQAFIDNLLVKPLIGSAFEGVTSLMNQKAQDLEEANAPFQAYYTNLVNRNNTFRTDIEYTQENQNGFVVNGQVDIGKLTKYIAGDLTTTLASDARYSVINPSMLSAFINEHAAKEAKRLAPDYQAAYNETLDIPDVETIQNNYSTWANRQAPKNPFVRIGKDIANFLGINTPETLDYENLKSHENLVTALGQNIGGNLGEVDKAMQLVESNARAGDGSRFAYDGLIIGLKEGIENGTFKGAIVPNSLKPKDRTVIINGDTYTINGMEWAEVNPDTFDIEYNFTGDERGMTLTKKAPGETILSEGEIKQSATKLELLTSNINQEFDEDNILPGQIHPGLWEWMGGNLEPNDPNNKVNVYAERVAHTARYIKKNYGDLFNFSEDELYTMATRHVVGQLNAGFVEQEKKKKQRNLTANEIDNLLLVDERVNLIDFLQLRGARSPLSFGNENTDVYREFIPDIRADIERNGGLTQDYRKAYEIIAKPYQNTMKTVLQDYFTNGTTLEFINNYEKGGNYLEKSLAFLRDELLYIDNNLAPEGMRQGAEAIDEIIKEQYAIMFAVTGFAGNENIEQFKEAGGYDGFISRIYTDPQPTPEPTPEPTPDEPEDVEVQEQPEVTPEPTPEVTPEPTPEPTPDEPQNTDDVIQQNIDLYNKNSYLNKLPYDGNALQNIGNFFANQTNEGTMEFILDNIAFLETGDKQYKNYKTNKDFRNYVKDKIEEKTGERPSFISSSMFEGPEGQQEYLNYLIAYFEQVTGEKWQGTGQYVEPGA